MAADQTVYVLKNEMPARSRDGEAACPREADPASRPRHDEFRRALQAVAFIDTITWLLRGWLLWTTVGAMGWLGWRSFAGDSLIDTVSLFGTILLSGVALVLGERRVVRRLRVAVRALAESEDVRAVGPLLDALKQRDKLTRITGAFGLERLLPRLRAGDGGLLTLRQRETLYMTLQCERRPLALAALSALAEIGGIEAVWYVERLTDEGYRFIGFPLAADTEVREAASRCLDAIRERLDRAQCSRVLLRAAEVGDVALLRPAPAAEALSPLQLVRPAEP